MALDFPETFPWQFAFLFPAGPLGGTWDGDEEARLAAQVQGLHGGALGAGGGWATAPTRSGRLGEGWRRLWGPLCAGLDSAQGHGHLLLGSRLRADVQEEQCSTLHCHTSFFEYGDMPGLCPGLSAAAEVLNIHRVIWILRRGSRTTVA